MSDRIDRAMKIEDAARLYRCMSSPSDICDGDACTTFAELAGLHYAPTFEEFCEVNRFELYERLLR